MSKPRRLTGTAKALRGKLTEAERVLWTELRAHRFAGYKFKRQEPMGSYVLDFVCYEAKLIVELDGGHHVDQVSEDAQRTNWLEREGFRVLRFWNNDVSANTAGVLMAIENCLKAPSPPVGEGRGEGE